MLSPENLHKVHRCLVLLQQANNLVNASAAALGPVPGFGEEWKNLCVLPVSLGEHRQAVAQRLVQVRAQRQELAGVRA